MAIDDNDDLNQKYDFAVWATQGGGLVSAGLGDDRTYRFVEAPPDQPDLKVGDELPPEWGLIPANTAATAQEAPYY